MSAKLTRERFTEILREEGYSQFNIDGLWETRQRYEEQEGVNIDDSFETVEENEADLRKTAQMYAPTMQLLDALELNRPNAEDAIPTRRLDDGGGYVN